MMENVTELNFNIMDVSPLTQEDFEVSELRNPYGSYRIKIKDSIGYNCGSLEDEEHLQHLKRIINEDQQKGINVELFEISQLINGEIIKTQLI